MFCALLGALAAVTTLAAFCRGLALYLITGAPEVRNGATLAAGAWAQSIVGRHMAFKIVPSFTAYASPSSVATFSEQLSVSVPLLVPSGTTECEGSMPAGRLVPLAARNRPFPRSPQWQVLDQASLLTINHARSPIPRLAEAFYTRSALFMPVRQLLGNTFQVLGTSAASNATA